MFLGHFAVAFAAKRVMPQVSLGTFFLAAQLADLLWPLLVIAGIEKVEVRPGATAVTPLDFVHYPYSHSLVALLGWALAFAVLYALAMRARVAASLIGAVVVSHWVLDVLTHRADVPITIGGAQRVGFGLWNSIPATIAIEGALFAVAVALYAKSTQALDTIGQRALWGLVAFLAVVYIAGIFGPPPPSPMAVAWTALSMWLLVAWGYWVDAHRRPTTAFSE